MDSGIYDKNIEFPLTGKRIAFVGRLEGMSHREASALVRSCGAKVSRKLDPNLNLIVIGDRESILLEGDGWLNESLIQAVDSGSLKILSETQLWELLDREKTGGRASGTFVPALSRLFTPSMLASMLELPVTTIRNWNKLGLIHPVRQVKKLPYYDLNEVASAKSLAQALHSGISPVVIRQKIEQLVKIIPAMTRSMDQLSILLSGPGVLFRREDKLMDSKGQLHFDLTFNDTVELSPFGGKIDSSPVADQTSSSAIRLSESSIKAELVDNSANTTGALDNSVASAAAATADSADLTDSATATATVAPVAAVAASTVASSADSADSLNPISSADFPATIATAKTELDAQTGICLPSSLGEDAPPNSDFTSLESSLRVQNEQPSENRDLNFGYALDQALLQSDFSESCPQNWDAAAFREEIAWLQQSTHIPEALCAARLMVGRFGPTADDCVLMGELLYQLGDKSAARERYYMALELDDSNLEARLYLGCLLAEEGDLDSAAAAFNGCLSLHPDYPDARFQLATVLDEMGKTEEAQIHWLAFWKIAPPSPWKRVAAQRLGFNVDWEDEPEEPPITPTQIGGDQAEPLEPNS